MHADPMLLLPLLQEAGKGYAWEQGAEAPSILRIAARKHYRRRPDVCPTGRLCVKERRGAGR